MGCAAHSRAQEEQLSREIAPIDPLDKAEAFSQAYQTIESLSDFVVFNASNFPEIRRAQLLMQRGDVLGGSEVREPSQRADISDLPAASSRPRSPGTSARAASVGSQLREVAQTVHTVQAAHAAQRGRNECWDFSNAVEW